MTLHTNPGPGYLFCPHCRAGAFSRRVSFTGKASAFIARAYCAACKRWSETGRWMSWNQARG